MTYKIKSEFIDLWGEDATIDTVLTENDLETICRGWDKPVNEILNQLIPQCGYTLLHRFTGEHSWQELNELIREESGVQEPYCETEEDYREAVREGFVKFEDGVTTVWED